MKQTKEFSIIIPAHNAEKRLSVPLHSIISQCYDRDKFEIIVICDACDDRTAEVAREYGADVVKEVRHGNAGLARNEGLEAASGDWVLFMDDDDHWLGECVLAFLHRYAMADDFDIACFSFYWSRSGAALPFDNGGNLFPNVWSKMWRRSFIGETRFRNVYPNDDELFCVDMISKRPRIRVSDNMIYYYDYMRPGSITDAERKKKDACKE